MRLIYLETTIWNILSDQELDTCAVCESLTKNDWQIVLGFNAYYEMLKSFYGKRRDRGSKLFSSVFKFLKSGVPILRTWEEVLIQESQNVLAGTSSLNLYCDEDFRSKLTSAAQDLASGHPHTGTEQLIRKRDAHSIEVKDSATRKISGQPEMLSDLRSVNKADLSGFLDEQVHGATGACLLAKYLMQIYQTFDQDLPISPDTLAGRLLESESSHVARTIVRSDIYQCWKAAQKESPQVRRCVPDDSYHVVNASYCDVFVTEDKDGQVEAARHALAGCEVVLYDNRNIPFFVWLGGVLADIETRNLEEQIRVGREVMAKHHDTFRALAKN